jgi:CBS domain containing-hemolysin-like protein
MDNRKLVLIVSLGGLICLSAFFSASETSFTSLNRIKLKNLALGGNWRAKLALKLFDAYDKLLSTVLIGNNIVNIASSALATLLFVELFGPGGVSLAALVMTLLILVFGEISPKTLAKESPEFTALRFAPLLRFFIVLFSPLNYLSAAWKKIIVRIFPASGNRAITEDELLTFVGEVRQEGGINRQEEEMIRQAIEFDDLTAARICTPRMEIAAVCEHESAAVIDSKFAETGFSRLPVFRGSVDNIIGIILLKDFHHWEINEGKAVASVLKPAIFVTKTIKISRLLKTLQQKRAHMAVVVDEFGVTFGIVTVEDIVEELVGEIWDEHDEVMEPITEVSAGVYRVMGNTSLSLVFEFIRAADGVEQEPLPDISVGSWALENIGALPKPGDEFTSLGLQVTVAKVRRHRVLEAVVRASGRLAVGIGTE